MTEELLAQMVEVMSVFASDRRLKEPRIIPRPGIEQATEEAKEARAVSHGGLLDAALAGGRVVVDPSVQADRAAGSQ